MSPDDDRLAPVTPIGRRVAPQGEHPSLGSAAGRGGRGAWGRDLPTSGGAGSADGGADDWGSGELGADELGAGEAGDAGGSSPKLRALPTYADFAAKSEPELRQPEESTSISAPGSVASARVRLVGDGETDGGDEAASGPAGSEPEESEPEESREAAALRAENVSLHALARRGVSSKEMVGILRSRDLPDEVVFAEVERLERVGLLDDLELAENLVRTKQDRKGLGKGAITQELKQRGIDPEAIDAAVAEIDDDDEQARCDEWAVKRAGQLRGLDHATAERRLTAFLMRRGYRSEVVRRAIEKALPRGGGGSGVRFR